MKTGLVLTRQKIRREQKQEIYYICLRGSKKKVTFSSNLCLMVQGLRDQCKEAKKRRKETTSFHQSYYEDINLSHMMLEQLDMRESGYLVITTRFTNSEVTECCESLFYQRDNKSRRLAGKREIIPRFEVKKQKKKIK